MAPSRRRRSPPRRWPCRPSSSQLAALATVALAPIQAVPAAARHVADTAGRPRSRPSRCRARCPCHPSPPPVVLSALPLRCEDEEWPAHTSDEADARGGRTAHCSGGLRGRFLRPRTGGAGAGCGGALFRQGQYARRTGRWAGVVLFLWRG